MRSNKALPLLFVLILFPSPGRADSTATATATLDWNAATFSGSVQPAAIPNPFSSLTEVILDSVTSGFTGGSTVTSPGWASTTDFLKNGAASTMFAQSGAKITAQTTAVASDGFFSLNSQAEHSGDLTTSTGLVSISIPYSMNILLTPGTGKAATTQVWIQLWNAQGNMPISAVGEHIAIPPSSAGSQDATGTLTLNIREAPGTYWFDVGAASSSVVVPESDTLLLTLTGFVSVLLFRKLASVRW